MSSDRLRIKVDKPWMAYPGPPVQQNYAEGRDHGFLLWDIDNRDHFDVEFCALPNPKPFITIEWAGSVEATLAVARQHPRSARFRVRNKEVLTQKEVQQLTGALRQELKAVEVTYKSDRQVNRDVINTGGATLMREDLRNPEVLLRLLKSYHNSTNVTEMEWESIREQVGSYLQQALDVDDTVRHTKWSLRHLKFDNTFSYGEGNHINFDQLNGIIGVFGANTSGKSSVVGTIMYSLFNTTDRGSVKNLHVVNVRHPYCYAKAIVNVNGINYVVERQTVKHESKRGQVHANTALNVFRIDEEGEAIDLAGEQRNDTEKMLRKLIGNSDDCLLTSVAAQDDVKLFISQGTTKRRKDLSRFLDLDVFDKMHLLANEDVKVNRSTLKAFPERDWKALEKSCTEQLKTLAEDIKEKEHLLNDVQQLLHDKMRALVDFKDFTAVTQSQVEAQQARVTSLLDKLVTARGKLVLAEDDIDKLSAKIASIEAIQSEHDLQELKRRLDSYRILKSSFESLQLVHEADALRLKSQERSLKILDEVPCGDTFPGCKFIKDAFKVKDKVEPQREKVARAQEKLQKAEQALAELEKEDLAAKVTKVEQLTDMLSKLKVNISTREVEVVRLQAAMKDVETELTPARQRLDELKEALKNEENVEVVALRNSLDDLQRIIKKLDSERLVLASQMGHVQSDHNKTESDRKRRSDLLQQMKVHELISTAFSRYGIPSMIVASQLPLINAEIAAILNGIVNFTVELEQDDDSDSMEVYIDYGDSKRIIELGSGMEKMIASMAIRVALINVSSLPKTDMLIIDESFGALDPANVEACNRLLTSLKRYFRTIIVITHVEGVKDIADYVIEIAKVEKDAKITYGDL